MNKAIKKVIILGSGALKIGQAGEFDYSGSQAIKALKEEGIKTILINPNIATIQTSKDMADEVYFLPVTSYFVEKVIEKEKPDGILLAFGGQTALNCGIELFEKGILKKHNVKVVGTPVEAIILTEDRQKFAKHLKEINVSTPISKSATTLDQAIKIAEKIGYPVMIRAGFALGGQGSGIAKNLKELKKIANGAFAFSSQILVEQYLHHFKEIEYEVVRDTFDNCITVCNMENLDPLGIHTGDSIVVSPSQTLTNEEFHKLREISIKIVKSLKIVGECNVQFALNPKKMEYFVIEVNARLSRSSALASKATGYPLAYIAAKLGLGYNLTALSNSVTKVTQACFEPALDYIVVKIPRWDLNKFKNVNEKISSAMKSVGEVMGIGRTFEEAYQKAIRMLDLDYEGACPEEYFTDENLILKDLKTPTQQRVFSIASAIKMGMSLNKIHTLTGIDLWFLYRIKNIIKKEAELLKNKHLDFKNLSELKQLGFSDKRIGKLVNKTGLEIRTLRKKLKILPSILQIDTLAGEFPAKTNYLYMTYNANHNDVKPVNKNSIIILGSGPYRIGSSVEFDWCSVNAALRLKKWDKKSIVINCNPETVSTDYDISDRLYFEELTFERIADIYEFENPEGIIVSVGGQTPNNRSFALSKYGFKILGTDPENIDKAEDRNKFSKLLDTLKVKQPEWITAKNLDATYKFAEKVGYPVLIRPSYVLSGSAMNICFNKEQLAKYLKEAVLVSPEYPITVSKFFEKTREIEFDAVAQKGEIKAFVISEHIENAGVHSGDATISLPTRDVNNATKKEIEEIAKKLSKALNITGPFNNQFLARQNNVYMIEIDLRASRTFPFISKVTNINFINLFIDALFKKVIFIKTPNLPFIAIKAPQFSFSRLDNAVVDLSVEMASTGEVASFGKDSEEAYLNSIISTGFNFPQKGIVVSIATDEKKEKMIDTLKLLPKLDLPIYATIGTSKFLQKYGIKSTPIYKIQERKSPNALDLIKNKKVDLVINIINRSSIYGLETDHELRRAAINNNVFLTIKVRNTRLLVRSITKKTLNDIAIKPWSYYLNKIK